MNHDNELLRSIGSQDQCLNCGAARDGTYCRECGQRFVVGRLSVRVLLREMPARFFSMDGGFLPTFIGLWKGPGVVARRYVLGERKQFANPFAFFLVAASAQLIVLAIMGPAVKTKIADNMMVQRENAANPAPFESLDQIFSGESDPTPPPGLTPDEELAWQERRKLDTARQMASLYLATMRQGYTYAAFFFFCLPFAAFLRVVHSGGDPPYKLAEHLVFGLYTVSQLLIATALSNLIMFQINDKLQIGAALTIYVIYALVAHRGFYPAGLGSVARTMIAFVGAVAVFFVSLIAVFAATVAAQALLARFAQG